MTRHAARAALTELSRRQLAEAALLACDRFASDTAAARAITRMSHRRTRIARLARAIGADARAGG